MPPAQTSARPDSAAAVAVAAAAKAAVEEELRKLHTTLSFASPSSHLYHEASTTRDRPVPGEKLSARSNLNTVTADSILQRRFLPAMNRLGAPITVDAFGATTRAIVAGGGLDAQAALAIAPDAEQRALAARLAALPADPEMEGTKAHEIMKRDTVRGVIRVISGGTITSTHRAEFPPHPEGFVKRTARR